ncbi:hypothetical protein Fmac_025224 [Flemingia macrophylla]|uniref:Uncharacterized protein n=1 Tax=Flemingia macrophylla TaxID=520843 RepID=A0ABD1LRS3_9FABA
MERWSGVLRVPLHPNSRTFHRVGATLCLSPETRTLRVPIANAIFFCGDRVKGTGNPVIERLSDLQKLSEIVKKVISGKEVHTQSGCTPSFCFSQPKTFILGFSKGGTVLNQIVIELGFSDVESNANSPSAGQPIDRHPCGSEEIYIVPRTKEGLLNSISEIHYVDVGLNSAGAYLTNHDVFERISKRLMQGAPSLRFILHGTPRQWSDKRRDWIRSERDKMLNLLESEAPKSGGKLKVLARYYFADEPASMQMHFEIIESLDVS